MKKKNLIAEKGLIALVGLCLICSSAMAKLFNPETFSLANGLQVIVLTNSRAPIVKQILVYKVGAIDEPISKSGIAHFLEHLMFKGTKNVSGKELDKANERMGADQNAQTGYDFTMYHQEVVKNDLEYTMKLEADRMQNLSLNEKDVETERPVILEERRMRIDNEPGAILREAINAAFFRHHPYQIPIIGWEHEMETLNQKDARDFYDAWYAPNNAILILAGDITLTEAKALAEKYYGPVPKKTLPARKVLAEPDHRGINLHVEKSSNRVEEPVYKRIYSAPSLRENSKAYYAMQILEHILSSGANSYLYDSLVQEQKVATWVSANYNNGMSRGPASLEFSGQPGKGKTLVDLEKAILTQMFDLKEKGVTKEQIEKAKIRIVADIDYIRDDSFGSAVIFAQVLGSGFEINDVEDWKDHISEVTLEDVNALLRAVLTKDDYLTAHLLPEKKVEKAS